MLAGRLGDGRARPLALDDLIAAGRVFLAALTLAAALTLLGSRAERPSEFGIVDVAAQMHEANLATPEYGGSPLARWDSDWYYSIAARGYRYNGNPQRQQNVAFFPAYPLVTGALWRAFGGPWTAWGLTVSWAAMLAFLAVLHALARTVLPREQAAGAVWLAGLWPAAFYGFAAYQTPLIALACTAALLLALHRSWLAAALAAGLATATGSLGVAAAIAVLIGLASEWRRGRMAAWQALALGVLSFWGVAAFSLYLLARFGDPVAYASVQAAWQTPAGALERLTRLLTLAPFRHALAFAIEKPALPVAALLTLLMLAGMLLAWRRLPRLLSLYTLLALALAFLASAGGTGTMGSMARITYSATPAFLALAAVLPRWAARAVAVLLAFGLAFYAWRFGTGVFVE